MRLKVKVNNQIYNVSVENRREIPIRVDIDGELFEVWLETNIVTPIPQAHLASMEGVEPNLAESHAMMNKKEHLPAFDGNSPSIIHSTPNQKLLSVRAPIPGVITAISTQVGAEVTIGQELCTLEAMKMNNSIRANHNGIISEIFVTIGQNVKHNDVLIEFAN